MKWIAVDYGERRTGLAVCDASELIVTPVTPQIEEKSLNKVPSFRRSSVRSFLFLSILPEKSLL